MKMKKLALMFAAILTSVTSVGLADPVGGRIYQSGTIYPGQERDYVLILQGDETTRFEVVGDGDGDIDCLVTDADGDILGRDTDNTDTCLIDVFMREVAPVKLHIKNNGRLFSNYFIKIW